MSFFTFCFNVTPINHGGMTIQNLVAATALAMKRPSGANPRLHFRRYARQSTYHTTSFRRSLEAAEWHHRTVGQNNQKYCAPLNRPFTSSLAKLTCSPAPPCSRRSRSLLACSARALCSLGRLLRPANFACALCCAHSFACSLISLTLSLKGQ